MLNKRIMAGIICIFMLMPCFLGASAINPGASVNENKSELNLKQVDNEKSAALDAQLLRNDLEDADEKTEAIDKNKIVRTIIMLDGAPIAEHEKGSVLKPETTEYAIAKQRVISEQAQIKRLIESKVLLGDRLNVEYNYTTLANGFAADIPYGKLDEIKALPGVAHAYVDIVYLPSNIEIDPSTIEKNAIDATRGQLSEEKGINTTSYKGEGMTIAVIDTGLKMNHPMFADDVDRPALSRDYIANIIASGNLRARKADIADSYIRVKVPFQYDYGNNDADANPDGGSMHGTHVSGIACGNNGVNPDVDTVAPEAQLIAMKVFTTSMGHEGASTSAIYAALEDAYTIGVDVVNMSLGSPAGFTNSYDYGDLEMLMDRAADMGIIFSVSAGNSYSGAFHAIPSGMMYGINPDNSVIGSPSTLLRAFSIASCTKATGASRRMSDFSSWGATPDMRLKPEISANGDEVLSSVPNGGYARASGTSMSAPHVTGGAVIVKQYLEEKYPNKTPYEIQELVTTLLMNTATQIQGNNGSAPASPRKQGAGAMNIPNAVNTSAYITVPGSIRPKFDSMDDVNETGVYNFTFEIHNMSASEISYELTAKVMTERAEIYNGHVGETTVMTEKSQLLEASITSNFNNNTINVPSNGVVTVNATITLTESDKEYIKTNYTNGMYVEGFMNLISGNKAPLTVPYLCYFGDFSKPSAIDRGYYYNDLNKETNWANLFVNQMTTKVAASKLFLGDNPYHDNVRYLAERNAISPNSDSLNEALEEIYVSLLRGVKSYRISIRGIDNTEYYKKETDYVSRTVYAEYGMMYCAGKDPNTAISKWRGKDDHGKFLPNNTEATINVEVAIDFSLHDINNECSVWSLPITIDTEAPSIKNTSIYAANGHKYIDVTVYDNQFLANISFTDTAYSEVYKKYPIAETERGLEKTYTYDVTDYPTSFGIIVNDYACNKATYEIVDPASQDAVDFVLLAKKNNGKIILNLSLDYDNLDPQSGVFAIDYPSEYLEYTGHEMASDTNVSITINDLNPGKLAISFAGTGVIEEGSFVSFEFNPTELALSSNNGVNMNFTVTVTEVIAVDTTTYLPTRGCTYTYFYDPDGFEIGDVNEDGDINTGDAAFILRYVSDLCTLDENQLKLADVNGDGSVDTGDAALILKWSAGK
ncbi:MAG: S8 family serine peptidase [Clostridia bacterium]